MKAQVFLKLVGTMMQAQADYFANRTQTNLIAAKQLEKQVRAVVKEGKLEPDEPTAQIHVFTTEAFQEQMSLTEPSAEGEVESDTYMEDET
jgi:hypothetical protein